MMGRVQQKVWMDREIVFAGVAGVCDWPTLSGKTLNHSENGLLAPIEQLTKSPNWYLICI